MVKKILILFFLLGLTSSAEATSIIKVDLSETAADLVYDGTTFHTINDGIAGSTGDQNTDVNFIGFLVGVLPDITTPVASFTLSGVSFVGAPTIIGPAVAQTTNGGSFALYDAANTLLLSGSITSGLLTGSTGSSVGSFFNTTIGTFTGGTLLPLLDPNSLAISFALGGIVSTGGANSLALTGGGSLANFVANGVGIIDAAAIPEPVTAALLLSGIGALGLGRRMNRKA